VDGHFNGCNAALQGQGQRLPKIVKEGYRLPHNSHSGEARAFPDVGSVTMYVT